MILVKKVKTAIRQLHLLCPGEGVLIAVSGGPDSIALLHLLAELRQELGIYLEVAHLQHGIRGPIAITDARFVADLAESLNLPFHLREVDLPQMKRAAGKGNLEQLARVQRYAFFAEVAERRGLDKVATAHTQNDQAETVLMWFLRGAGSKGMAGMGPLQEFDSKVTRSGARLTVIRPLLEVSKTEIFEYLTARRLEFRIDESNEDTKLLRNWLRLKLLPAIEGRFDAGVPARLAQQAEMLRDENLLLEALARKAYDAMHRCAGIDRTALLREPKALRRRILRLWLEQTRGHLRGVEYIHTEAMLRLIEQGPMQASISLPGGWELAREYDTLRLEKQRQSRGRTCYEYPLKIEAVTRILEAKLEIETSLLEVSAARLPDNLMEAVLDLSEIEGALSLRNFRAGDRYQPLGMSGHKKIKDLFIEKHIPLVRRACWPLLVAGPQILWIPGYGRSAAAVLSQKTTAVLHLKARPILG